MGREVRRVPPNWDHPKVERRNGRVDVQPMHDRRFEDAAAEWKADFVKWESGWRPSYYSGDGGLYEFWEYMGEPPQRDLYRPWRDEDATWWQVWETVSEGTPVTPPFATQEQLIDYLVANGDFWDQSRRADGCKVMDCDPWPREYAERFVRDTQWAPSMVLVRQAEAATNEQGG